MTTMYDTGYAKGRKEAFEEMLKVLNLESEYGHQTFSLTYLRGLLKQIEEKRMITNEGYTLEEYRSDDRIVITLPPQTAKTRELSDIDLAVILQIIVDFTREQTHDN